MARTKRREENVPAYKRKTGSHRKVPIPVKAWLKPVWWLRWLNKAGTSSSRFHLDRRELKPMPVVSWCPAVPPDDRKIERRLMEVTFRNNLVCDACWWEYEARMGWMPEPVKLIRVQDTFQSGFPVAGDIPRVGGGS